MEIKLEETELAEAIDFWMRKVHPTLMEDKVISLSILTSYPPNVLLTIKPELPIPAIARDDGTVPF